MRAMSLFRQNRRFIAWLACLAIMLNSVMPAISHAMTATQDEPLLLEVCSAAGNKTSIAVQLQFEESNSSQDTQPAPMQHCPYCLAHADHFTAPQHKQPLLLIPNLSYALPELFYHAPRPLFAWATSQPRAPPFSS